jgi:hypothetical protein
MAARVVRIVKKAASMGTLVVVTVGAGAGARWLGMRPEGRAEQLWAGPSAVERFAERARSKGADQDGQRKPPLIQQAEAFAAYLNPPVPRKPAAAPAPVRPRPVRAEIVLPPPPPPLRLLGVSYYRGDPAESRALVLDANGCRWVKQGAQSGGMVVEQINPRSILCRGKGGMQEMTMETEPGSVVPVQRMRVPPPAGGPDDPMPVLAENDILPRGPEQAQPVGAVLTETPASQGAILRIEPPKKESPPSRPPPGRRPRPVRSVARRG